MSSMSKSGHSFDELVIPTRPHLVAHVRRVYRRFTAIDADDIVQDALIKAWRAWPKWSPSHADSIQGCVHAWMYRIVSNVAESSRLLTERQQRLGAAVHDVDHDDVWQRNQIVRSRAHGARASDRQIHLMTFGPVVSVAIARLHPNRRKILKLHFEQELSTKEIAEALGIPHVTVRTRLHRSLAALEPLLARCASESGAARVQPAELEAAEVVEPDAQGVDGVVAQLDAGQLAL